MSVKGGPLLISATWREGVFKDHEMESFHVDLKDLLTRIANDAIPEDAKLSQL
jgi:hypothetical protein